MIEYPKQPAEVKEFAKELAELLGETELVPVKQVKRIVYICGVDFAREIYNATMEIEDQGGIMLPDNSRRRTKGGVFFYLTRTKLNEELREKIFPNFKYAKGAKQKVPLGVPLMTWDERLALIQSLQTEQGEIKSMKVILTGRPGRIEKRPEVVITTMSDIALVQNLPRGVPTPPVTPIVYAVYMSPTQWERVEASLADPADTMMVDGVCVFDSETNGMAVLATSVRSEFKEAKMREEQMAANAKEKATKSTAPKAAKASTVATGEANPVAKATAPAQPQNNSAKKSRIADIQPEPVAKAAVPLNPNLPVEAARKLNELQASASLFRQKVANLQGKPAGQQFGLEMTQKLLKNVEDEIAALQKKYNI